MYRAGVQKWSQGEATLPEGGFEGRCRELYEESCTPGPAEGCEEGALPPLSSTSSELLLRSESSSSTGAPVGKP